MNTLKSNNHYLFGTGLSSFQLKLIAAITMLIDHSAQILFNLTQSKMIYLVCKSIGRLSFPLFCFLLIEGFIYTRNRKKHFALLTIFALISEPIFDLFHKVSEKSFVLFHSNILDFNRQSIMFSLLVGYTAIWMIDSIGIRMSKKDQNPVVDLMKYIFIIIIFIVACVMTVIIHSDYNYMAIFLIIGFYFMRGHIIIQSALMALVNILLVNMVISHGRILYTLHPQLQWIAMLAIIPIFLYSGEAGSKKMKYVFYIFYPAHLMLLALIKYWTI